MDVPLFKDAYESLKSDFLLSHAAYCRDVLKLKKGQKAVISNGRVSHSRDAYCLKNRTCGDAIKNKQSLFMYPSSHQPFNHSLL